MGGIGGSGISSNNLKTLEQRAKESLSQSASASHVFISFANEDINDINLLRAQAKNEKTDLEFDDHSLKEPFDSANANYIKAGISEKIQRASVTLVYLSPSSATSRWVAWEIAESVRQGKGVVGIYQGETPPSLLPQAFKDNQFKVVSWNHASITSAINTAKSSR